MNSLSKNSVAVSEEANEATGDEAPKTKLWPQLWLGQGEASRLCAETAGPRTLDGASAMPTGEGLLEEDFCYVAGIKIIK